MSLCPLGWPRLVEVGSLQASPPIKTKVIVTSVGDRAKQGSPYMHDSFLVACNIRKAPLGTEGCARTPI